nr:hypothetical protein [uncultured Bacillus sp.]
MDLNTNEIYSELRKTKQELLERLENDCSSPLIKPYLLGELQDIDRALEKLERGTFGTCEISGELLPADVLLMIPTLKSMDDCKTIRYFLRKA